MIFEQTIYDNTDVTAATGLSVATIQTCANRGILMLSKQQQNPGAGKAALQRARYCPDRRHRSLNQLRPECPHGDRIALRLERGLCADQWKEALRRMPTTFLFSWSMAMLADQHRPLVG